MVTTIAQKAVLVPYEASGLLKAFADPLRMEVIEVLSAGEHCVCELMKKTGLAQSRLSFHLEVLKNSALITDRQSGCWVYYKLNLASLRDLHAWTFQLMADCERIGETYQKIKSTYR